jgi:hypothetical protein
VVCHRDSHIQNDEGGAPEFYTHGAKLMLAEAPIAATSSGLYTRPYSVALVIEIACG